MDRPTGFLSRLQTFHGRASGRLSVRPFADTFAEKGRRLIPAPWVHAFEPRIEELNRHERHGSPFGKGFGLPSDYRSIIGMIAAAATIDGICQTKPRQERNIIGTNKRNRQDGKDAMK
ncbi:MAG: hypothetical protein ACYC3I_20790 [Gemmataceae bacterium]